MTRRLLYAAAVTLAGTLCLAGDGARAAGIAEDMATLQAAHAASRAIQRQIDRLGGADRGPSMTLEDRQLRERMRAAERTIAEGRERVAQAETQIRDLQATEAGLVPLLDAMLNLLDSSIDVDLPFDVAARKQAVAEARRVLSAHGLSLADRYARVLQAYLSEVRYGYTSDFASREIPISGEMRLVHTLRIGRVALYFVTASGSECGVWLPAEERYAPLALRDCEILDAARSETESDHADLLAILPLPEERP